MFYCQLKHYARHTVNSFGYATLRVFIPARFTFSLSFFIYTIPHPPYFPSLPSTLPPVDCHWAEITPVLLTHLGTRVKHTQGETW